MRSRIQRAIVNKLKEESVQNTYPMQSVEAKVKRLVDCAKEILGEGLAPADRPDNGFTIYALGLSEADTRRIEAITGKRPQILRPGESEPPLWERI